MIKNRKNDCLIFRGAHLKGRNCETFNNNKTKTKTQITTMKKSVMLLLLAVSATQAVTLEQAPVIQQLVEEVPANDSEIQMEVSESPADEEAMNV